MTANDLERLAITIDAARTAILATLEQLRRDDRGDAGARDGPLTAREREVLVHLASGKTNRLIAEGLAISEKTVARHVSNIFQKLALSTRSAAVAYAHRHHLV